LKWLILLPILRRLILMRRTLHRISKVHQVLPNLVAIMLVVVVTVVVIVVFSTRVMNMKITMIVVERQVSVAIEIMTTIMITALTLLLPFILLLATHILKCLNLDAIVAAAVLVRHLDDITNLNIVGILLMENAVAVLIVDSLMPVKSVVIFCVGVAVVLIVAFLMTKVKERHAEIFKKGCAIVVNHAVSIIQILIKKLKRKVMRVQSFQKLVIPPACKLARALKQMLALRRASNKRRGKMALAAAAATS